MRPLALDATRTASELLERDAELSALGECLETVRRGSQGRVVAVSGEAGVGKTALLRRFCEESGRSTRILWGACDPLFTPRPLGPLLVVAESAGGEFEKVVASGVVTPHEVVAALAGALRARAPSVFVLEDVHWADEATLDVLRLLARSVETVPALVIASYRDDELDRAHPLRIVLGELAASRTVARLKLFALSPAAVTRLAEPHTVDAEELYRKTGGNPFFVVEVLAAGSDQIPATVRDAVFARAARLSPPARRLLEAVAIVPTRAELWLLEALAQEAIDALDECLTSGMLAYEPTGVAFRHELARLAIEEWIPPNRRIAFHRTALAALAFPPSGAPDVARLAHHAEAAEDAEAVLRYAPEAAERAASVGAHREAAAQYARALLYADRLGLRERAQLLERLSDERFVLAEHDEAIAAVREALECYRRLGDRRKQADTLCTLARRLYCRETNDGARAAVTEAVEVLGGEPPCRELARAYALMAAVSMNSEDGPGTFEWGQRSVELADSLAERDILVYALNDLGTMEYLTGVPGGRDRLERSLQLAIEAGFDDHAARAFIHLAWVATRLRDYRRAEDYIRRGIEYCTRRDLELNRHYLVTRRAQMELGQGRWDEAAESAKIVIDDPRSSPDARGPALSVLALVRARRGDPEHGLPLEQALALIESGGDLQRIGPVVAAHAEILWLERRPAEIHEATGRGLALALQCKAPWIAGELAYWRWQAGVLEELPEELVAEPYRLSIAGDWAAAAERWKLIGCPYEEALALAESDDLVAVREAIERLQRLGARPAAAIVSRQLRERGERGIPRGPRPSTRENPAGLTTRELEVLALVAQGLRNAAVAERLVLAEKTVDHHVSAILRKLDVRTRGEASAKAARLGLVGQDG
jgi:DNA-binding CsgD family transcriptional regulator/tetratricopeptide (TPR) repeat protein